MSAIIVGALGVIFAFVMYGLCYRWNDLSMLLPATFLFVICGVVLAGSLHFHLESLP